MELVDLQGRLDVFLKEGMIWFRSGLVIFQKDPNQYISKYTIEYITM